VAEDAEKLSLAYLLGKDYNPVQAELILAPEYEVAAVTGMGAGKTYAACVAAFRHAVKYPGAFVLVGRLTFRELVDTTKKMFYEMVENKKLRSFIVKPANWDYRERTNVVRFKNGAEILFANLEPNRLDKLKNLEYSLVVIDQAEEIQYETYQLLLNRCRLNAVPYSDRHVIAIANDEGDNWLRRRFLTFEPPHGRPTMSATRRLLRGTSLANPNIDEGAKAQLLSLPPEVQARWVYATMDAGTSRLIPDFRVIAPFMVPAHWPRWVGVDPARSTGVTCAIWVAVNPDKDAYQGVAPNAPVVYNEYWAEGRDAEDHSQEILRQSGPHRLLGYAMDRSAWSTGALSRKLGAISVAQLYVNAGLPASPSSGDEWARVMLFLEAQKRGLVVFRTCTHLLRQGPEYRVRGQQMVDSTGAIKDLKIVSKQKFHAIDAGGYAFEFIPTKVVAVDTRTLEAAFDIADDIDDGSRRHWEALQRTLPKRKGHESVVTQGIDEAELHGENTTHAAGWWEHDDVGW